MEFPVADAPIESRPGSAAVAHRSRPVLPPAAVAYGLAAAAFAALLPTVFSPSLFSLTFTPKLALLLVVAALGAVPLFRLARSSGASFAARGAVAFLVVGLLSALLSSALDVSFFGLYDWGTGWLFWFGCAGAFALGAYLRPAQLHWLLGGIVFAGAVSSVVAVYQVLAKPTGTLGLFDGAQADAMLGNPIHLEALLLGCLALVAARACVDRNRMLWWPLVLLVTVALEFTFERLAIIVIIVIMAVALAVYGLRRAAPFVLLSAAGYALAYVSVGSGLGARVASSNSTTTYGTRFSIWRLALSSVAHHPFLGIGPGDVVSAIAPHIGVTFAAHLGAGTLPADSHNFVIEVLATTGILGLAAFVAWAGGAALVARGPFLACAVAILAVELVEPLNVGVTPVAMMALGAATVSIAGQPVGLAALRQWWSRWRASLSGHGFAATDVGGREIFDDAGDLPPVAERKGRRLGASVVVTSVLVVASLFVAVTMLIGDHYMLTTYNDISQAPKIATAKDANRLLPYWAESAAAVSEAYAWAADFNNSGPKPLKEAISWDLTAERRFPGDPILPADIGAMELRLGDRAAARAEDLRSIALDPWTYLSLEGLGTIAKQEGQWRTSLGWYEKALLVAPPGNNLKELIASDKAHLGAG
ncbi:MAG: O-antigen ligase family protein [Acidimicrobiales bacterium]